MYRILHLADMNNTVTILLILINSRQNIFIYMEGNIISM